MARQIFSILIIPSFFLAEVIGLYELLPLEKYAPFHLKHVLLLIVLLGTLSIFTYTNLLSILAKVKSVLAQLLAYLISLVVLLVGSFIGSKYVWLQTNYTQDSISLFWPINLSQTPLVVNINGFLLNIVLSLIISFTLSVLLKHLFKLSKRITISLNNCSDPKE